MTSRIQRLNSEELDILRLEGQRQSKQQEQDIQESQLQPPLKQQSVIIESWKEIIPQRKLKLHPALQGEEWINEKMISEHPWMNSIARNRALD